MLEILLSISMVLLTTTVILIIEYKKMKSNNKWKKGLSLRYINILRDSLFTCFLKINDKKLNLYLFWEIWYSNFKHEEKIGNFSL